MWLEKGVFKVNIKLFLFGKVIDLVILASTISRLYENILIAINTNSIFDFKKATSYTE